MAFDFDTPLSLRGTHCAKWDNMNAVFTESARPRDGSDTLPMWIADMDFAAAPAIRMALEAEAARGYFGYFGDVAPVSQAVTDWLRTRHGWSVDPRWVRYSHGVIGGVATSLDAFTKPGDGVILFTPVYHTFFKRIRAMGRVVHESRLVLRDGRYDMDLDALEGALTPKDRAVIFCSPHNPGGRLWSADEIRALAAFCARNDLLLISDEIHMDLCFPGATFTPAAVAAPESLPRLIVLTAASKGFNVAGGETGLAIIPDDALRARYDASDAAWGASPNRFGMAMLKAAFTDGGEWSEAVRAYIAENFAIFRNRIDALPGIRVMDMQCTYLAWVDFAGTGMTETEVRKRLAEDACIASSPGRDFGAGGETWNRFNVAMPRALLLQAIERIEGAFADLQ
jgi:cystathionine beta-lyase